MLPGDRLVCAFVESEEVGLQFKNWLLHVTIVPWFRLPDPSETIAAGLQKTLKTIQPFDAVAEAKAMFGPRKNRPAMLIIQPTPFMHIEEKVRSYFHQKRAWLVDETTQNPRRFRPHVTAQGKRSLKQGEIFECDRLYVVEQEGNYKQIVAEVKFGD